MGYIVRILQFELSFGGSMNFMYSDNSVHWFLSKLDVLSHEESCIPCDQFQQILQNLSGPIPAKDLFQVVDFSANQLGQWQARWLFSSKSAPDIDAARETYAWRVVWEVSLDKLTKSFCDVYDHVSQKKESICFKSLLQKSREYNRDKPLAKLTANLVSRLAFWLNTMGLTTVGTLFYKMALFPPGTLGRFN